MGKSKYKIVQSLQEVKQVIQWCKQTKYASVDFETSGGSQADELQYPTIIGISFQIGSTYIIPLGHKDSIFKKEYPSILKLIGKEIIENPDIIKIAWNMKFEEKWFMRYGISFKGRCFDGMLAKYLLNEERPNDLKSIVRQILPGFSDYEEEVDGIATKVGWANVPLVILSKYCGLDCDLTLRLMVYFEGRLIKAGFYNLFRNLIMPGSHVLAKSEFKGLPVNVKYLDKLIVEYKEKIEVNELKLRNHKKIRGFEKRKKQRNINKLINQIKYEIKQLENKPNSERLIKNREEKVSRLLVGEMTNNKEKKLLEPINFNSVQQMVELLYLDEKAFNFPIVKYTKDKYKQETENPSTDEEALDKLREKDNSGFIAQLLTHRELNKMYGTYMVGMRKLVTEDNRVHADFKIHGTVTGRLSCTKPNLQQIPRGDTPIAATIKKMFIAPKGKIILQIDYAQAELRVMAEAADETTMLKWFKDGKDIHTASACKKYDESYEKIIKLLKNEKHKDYKLWKKRRKQAKTINFGIIFCQTAKKLAITLSEPPTYDDNGKKTFEGITVSKEEAQQFLNAFNKDFPKVVRYMRNQRIFAKEHGYVKTFFGRKRRLPNIYDSNDGIRMEAERQSVNAPIQGTASDFAFFSSVLIAEEALNHKEWELEQMYTVHDSLGFSINPQYVHKAVPIINKICENPQTKKWFGFEMKKVKMAVDFEVDPTWGELKKYNKEVDYSKLIKSSN